MGILDRSTEYLWCCLLGAMLLVIAPRVIGAQELIELPPPLHEEGYSDPANVLQKRQYDPVHEIAFFLGSLPANPFHLGFSGTLLYGWHLSQHMAIEVVGTGALHVDKHLRGEVLKTRLTNLDNTAAFPHISASAGGHFVLKPLYGKWSAFNHRVFHLEFYLYAGARAAWARDVLDESGLAADRLLPGGNVGLGARLWVDKNLSCRIDFDESLFWGPTEIIPSLQIRLGLAYSWERVL